MEEALTKAGATMFRDFLKRAQRKQAEEKYRHRHRPGKVIHGPGDLKGVTLFAVENEGFLGARPEEMFDGECWDLHILEVPLLVGDLVCVPGNKIQPRSHDPQHALRMRTDVNGDFVIWVAGDSDPPRRARVVEADIKVEGGIVVHVLDKVLYAE